MSSLHPTWHNVSYYNREPNICQKISDGSRISLIEEKKHPTQEAPSYLFAIKKQEDKKGLAQVCPLIRQWKYVGIGLIFNKGFSPL